MHWLSASHESDEGEWISISDLMAGLMIIFLFIAIAFIRPILETNQRIEKIVTAWKGSEQAIYDELQKEFQNDLQRWNADIVKESLTVRFRSPDILFNQGGYEVNDKFLLILNEFFPRYARTLRPFKDSVTEIRVEGHTSSEWSRNAQSSPDSDYFNNMNLSQQRTQSVLRHSLLHPQVAEDKAWLKDRMTANGLSSSRLIRDAMGREDPVRSRRVEFSVRTDAKEQMVRVIETIDAPR